MSRISKEELLALGIELSDYTPMSITNAKDIVKMNRRQRLLEKAEANKTKMRVDLKLLRDEFNECLMNFERENFEMKLVENNHFGWENKRPLGILINRYSEFFDIIMDWVRADNELVCVDRPLTVKVMLK